MFPELLAKGILLMGEIIQYSGKIFRRATLKLHYHVDISTLFKSSHHKRDFRNVLSNFWTSFSSMLRLHHLISNCFLSHWCYIAEMILGKQTQTFNEVNFLHGRVFSPLLWLDFELLTWERGGWLLMSHTHISVVLEIF